jgi:hypothetical protein
VAEELKEGRGLEVLGGERWRPADEQVAELVLEPCHGGLQRGIGAPVRQAATTRYSRAGSRRPTPAFPPPPSLSAASGSQSPVPISSSEPKSFPVSEKDDRGPKP